MVHGNLESPYEIVESVSHFSSRWEGSADVVWLCITTYSREKCFYDCESLVGVSLVHHLSINVSVLRHSVVRALSLCLFLTVVKPA